MLTINQLQNGCNVQERFRLDKRHMGDHIPMEKTLVSCFTSAKLGEYRLWQTLSVFDSNDSGARTVAISVPCPSVRHHFSDSDRS